MKVAPCLNFLLPVNGKQLRMQWFGLKVIAYIDHKTDFTSGPAWWKDELVFSDTRLGKIFSWDPKTKQVGVVLELAGNKNRNTGIVLEPFSNGLEYNKITDELLICEHGSRGISWKWLNWDDFDFRWFPTLLHKITLNIIYNVLVTLDYIVWYSSNVQPSKL